ncbi:flagellar hook protein FlgE [Aquariibacter albus]|uniref:Flagellar hook protein FlgE n=1 Tax=Aquariibacter albus TaxID=2759899 RepID=A0A839HIJ8_9BURK|nr:flagellar hook protein FlgE [Aquariibacter albus]MBB1160652.1 flagellar hook protein FlgE [Aquariibacter albus]
MSFQQGLSGLNASSKNLEVIGNNVANASTVGFKGSRAEFADLYAGALNRVGNGQIGIGVNLQAVAQQFTQGNITLTENPLDLAINGSGFFQLGVLSGAGTGTTPPTFGGETYFSRNGQFKLDRFGQVVNNEGMALLGRPLNANGLPGATLGPVTLPTGGLAAAATTTLSLEMNLDARATLAADSTLPLDPADPSTYNHSTPITVYDGTGEPVEMTLYFRRIAGGAADATTTPPTPATDRWQVFAATAGTTSVATPAGTLAFDASSGSPWPAGAASFNLGALTGTSAAGDPISLSPITLGVQATGYAASSATTQQTQNGHTYAGLSSVSVEDDGTVRARFSNGQYQDVYRLELATFRNPQGLEPQGNNRWAQTLASGDRIVNAPGLGNLGNLQSGALEDSNVDLTGELVNMITAQRVYQANAQTIKTQDSVLQTLVNLR